jgi:hypothetical protein
MLRADRDALAALALGYAQMMEPDNLSGSEYSA